MRSSRPIRVHIDQQPNGRNVAGRKRMLFLSEMFPLPVASGSQVRTLNLIQRFSERFDITLLTLAADPGYQAHLGELGQHCVRVVPVVPSNKRSALHRAVFKALYWVRRIALAESADRFYNTVPSVNRAIRAELERSRFDVIFCEYWYWDAKLFEAPGLKVIDANDVQSQRVESLLERTRNPIERILKPFLIRRYKRWEAEALNRADVVVAATTRDRQVFETMVDGETDQIVIPTGLDTDYFVPQLTEPDLKNVVFYGSLANPVNRDALQHLVHNILPRIRERVPGSRLTIVGAFPTPEARAMAERDPNITLTGYVEDVREPLAEAGVVVVPLRFGYGIRGRVFELLSMSVPVVATPVAVAGMELSSGDGLLLAERPNDFADAVVQVLSDPTLRADLRRRGREIAVSRLSIAATYDRLTRFLERRTTSTAVPVQS
ncbi:MAG: glycosyltransferase family 4 protein [Candidatus Krumholzibacteriia bacterium]